MAKAKTLEEKREDALSRTRTSRPTRTPISGARNVLNVRNKKDGFVYRIVNNVGDRIAMFQGAGWEIEDDPNVTVGDRRVNKPSSMGSGVEVSVGGGQKAFLMRLPVEFYEENKAELEKRNKAAEEDIKERGKQSSDYGKVTIE